MCDDNIFKWAHSRIKRRHPEWNKVCPHCKRKSFSPLIDIHTERPVDDKNCGICDHRSSCGYKMNYTEWKEECGHLKERPTKEQWIALKRQREKEAEQIRRQEAERKANSFAPNRKTQPVKVQAYLDRMAVLCHEMHTPDNRFMDYLYTLDPSKEKVDKAFKRYCIGSTINREIIYWQIDREGRVRTGKIMNYDPATGKRIKGEGSYVNWMHSIMRAEGALPESWELMQCLYGEHLLPRRPTAVVALAEGPKTAHVGAALMPHMVWVAVDSMMGLTVERLRPLRGRCVVLFPDEGRGYEEWVKRIESIAHEVGFVYAVSQFIELNAPAKGDDIGDLLMVEEECPF